MIKLSGKPYDFDTPPDCDWLPSPFALFEEDRGAAMNPTRGEIKRQCQEFQLDWDFRERELRKLRSEMACRFGICRND